MLYSGVAGIHTWTFLPLLIIWIFCGIGATFVASSRGGNGCFVVWFRVYFGAVRTCGIVLRPRGTSGVLHAARGCIPKRRVSSLPNRTCGERDVIFARHRGLRALGCTVRNCGLRMMPVGNPIALRCREPLSPAKTSLAPRRSAPAGNRSDRADRTSQQELHLEKAALAREFGGQSDVSSRGRPLSAPTGRPPTAAAPARPPSRRPNAGNLASR